MDEPQASSYSIPGFNSDGYVVTQTVRDTDVNPATNRIERGWTVYYTDGVTNTPGEVFVPDRAFTAEGTRQLILAQLAQVRAVHGATG